MEIIIILLILSVIIIQIISILLQNKNNKNKNIEIIDILNKNIENEKEIFLQIENSLALKNKNTLLEGLQDVSKNLFRNNENLLVRFNDFGVSLSGIVAENNKILTRDINTFKDEFKNSLNKDFEQLNQKVEAKLEMINLKVEDRLTKGFEQTTKTFNNIIERLSKIDEAQKKIDLLSTNIISLQDVLTDKKSRGIFGEVQLNQILKTVFGEKNDKVFNLQYKLSTGVITDAIIFAPEPVGNICIDSKFPLENYKKMYDQNLEESQRDLAKKEFVINLKKHVDDISSKYIIGQETADQAIMFLPAEAIFAEINAYHSDIIEYASKRKVWLTSPTTLMSVLTTLQVVMMNIERDKYAHVIQEELVKLGQEFDRYQKRWTTLERDIDKVHKDVKDITTTSNKISKRFDQISNVKLLEVDTERVIELENIQED
ncbi:MAG: DNA recombination protein RmuC [Sebaldella sp.]|nr:DNA recombination protein RmuC [Sebaldella sp.]